MQVLRENLQEAAERSRQAQSDLDARWPQLLAMTAPQDLYVALEDQQEACESMLRIKDEVIVAMREMLAKKDGEYAKTLTVQTQVGPVT